MAQFQRQKPPRAGSSSGLPGARAFPGSSATSLLGLPPGLLSPPVAAADLLQSTRHLQGGEKQRVFTGIVTSLHDYFGVVDEEVFFQLSAVKGRIPQIGEKVLVKAVYNPSQAVPWNALKVQTLSNQPLLKTPAPLLHVASLGQKQGILGAQPQLLFQPHRIPPLFPQKPISLFQSSPSLHLGHVGRYPARGPKIRQDTGRWDEFESKKRKQKGGEPWGVKKPRHDPPQYRVHFARYAVDSTFCDAMEILRRYCSIQLPPEFYDLRICWPDTFPLTRPLPLRHPSRIQVAEPEELTEGEEDIGQEVTLEEADAAFAAKVMLLSSPGLEEFYRHCLLYIEDPGGQRETPEHPTKLIKFLLGKKEDEAVLIGGEWVPSMDGSDPDADPMVLVRTAIRCTKAQTGLDLSSCTKWVRFAEFRYLHQGEPAQQEKVVVFLPDVWSCMPSLEQWEALCQQKAEKVPLPPPSPEKGDMEVESPEQHTEANELAAVASEEATAATPGPQDPEPEPELEAPTPPLEPAIIAHPSTKGGQPSCSNLSLHTLLEYRQRREKLSFEVAVVAELFQEMLQRDFGYKIYKALLTLPQKELPEAKNQEPERAAEPLEKAQEKDLKEEEAQETPTVEGATASDQEPAQPPQMEHTGNAEVECQQPAGSEEAKVDERVKGECKTEPRDSTDELCMLSLEDDLLLLREDEEEDFGAKLDDSEVRSNASNQSDMEFSSFHDAPKELDPSAVLPLDALLAFVYFDLNFCGYLHRRDLEKILLTLGLHLCKEQVKRLVSRVVTQYVCQYRNLHYSRQEGLDPGTIDQLPEEELLGNLFLLPPSTASAGVPAQPKAVVEHGDLVSHNGTVLNVGKLLEKAEQTESGRLYLESKIHTLEVKLEETQVRFSATESTNKTLVSELQELQKRLTEAEEQARAAERQKAHFQRLLQENKKRLAPLQLEIQRIIEKTNNCLEKKEPAPSN
ncbi:cell cycle and apoptosis regulator protein 2 isoform X2 [Alligator mississippiensis]|uniref:Cell cycle and apoptosis regulator protein 2 n=1 Tax=Alligator mississippiensis TaxID=8496 RepID=A0A151P695_ALLMI|nr:cell cycle and apoptosis regulator protein 2 isoform X2 [Alligator mississippiensis]XP_019338013.2 cell cycle and apoptosis regulator protein 2 isoform X2 [Alligator mississippiensis]XP_019338014.1 cell cycle and apoptosis regulator protein 2 isoform X2 [Alligator mississippiensis]XP_019338015.1 cell cycle and apoptosis regulator protein 2 isoform X2 [Alligator mississippiensis]KYO44490.1 cell cycle and apoptosis regulator protein 2 [Alligator mississippiensis]